MPRSITESITALENARNDIVDALNSKIEGGGIEKSLKISEVASKINQIEVGGGSGGNEIDVSSNDWHALTIGKSSLIIMAVYNGDTVPNFFIQSGSHPVAETTLIYNPCTYIYIGLFDNSDQKVEIRCVEDYDDFRNITYSGLIDVSTPKVFVVKKANYSSGQEPQK